MDVTFTERRSARLRITRMLPSHAIALSIYRSQPQAARYQSWHSFSLAESHRFIAGMQNKHPDTPGEWFQFAIEDHAGTLIGDCAMGIDKTDERLAEIGFTIAPEHWRRGFAREALSCLLDYAFTERKKHRISATTDVQNQASIGLLETLGFQKEAHFRKNIWFKGAWGDEFVYARLYEDFRTTGQTTLE